MAAISGFWDVGPHDPVSVEATWQEFVRELGGQVVSDLLPEPRLFENADFLFAESGVVAELKEVETEFSKAPRFFSEFDGLMKRLMLEQPDWKPPLFGASGRLPGWFTNAFLRLFRPPLARIVKKANRQIRDTKLHFDVSAPTGVLILVNDGFTSLEPHFVRGIVSDLLVNSYSSIDCFLYLTLNRYVDTGGGETPSLLWLPAYSDRAPDKLVEFVDELGSKWFNFLEPRIGPFTNVEVLPVNSPRLRRTKVIVMPGKDNG